MSEVESPEPEDAPDRERPGDDRGERPSIVPYPDGPLIVRGAFHIRTADGGPIPQHRRTVALCRCGLSNIKPWCDGTHKAAGFRTDA
ncbi:hypothetical protein FM113_10310 [Leucobacter sp. 7(1)]|nr:hypothetical protein FM113_10310 [Leucobacter sp. 7(1)]